MAEVFGGPEAKTAVEAYGRRVENEIKSLESDTPEADIINTLVEMVNDRGDDAPEYIAVADLVNRLNNGESKGPWTPPKVGKRLTALGFRRMRLQKGCRGYRIDYELLKRLAHRYGIGW